MYWQRTMKNQKNCYTRQVFQRNKLEKQMLNFYITAAAAFSTRLCACLPFVVYFSTSFQARVRCWLVRISSLFPNGEESLNWMYCELWRLADKNQLARVASASQLRTSLCQPIIIRNWKFSFLLHVNRVGTMESKS